MISEDCARAIGKRDNETTRIARNISCYVRWGDSYGLSFFSISGPPLAVGLTVEIIICYVLNRLMLLLYVPMFFALVLASGLGSKNLVRNQEVSNMGHLRGFLFLIVSALAIAFPFLAKFPNDLYGLFQFLLTFSISPLWRLLWQSLK